MCQGTLLKSCYTRPSTKPCTAVQSMTFGGNQDPELVDMIARWVIAMPYVLKGHITDVMDLSTQLEVRSGDRRRGLGLP